MRIAVVLYVKLGPDFKILPLMRECESVFAQRCCCGEGAQVIAAWVFRRHPSGESMTLRSHLYSPSHSTCSLPTDGTPPSEGGLTEDLFLGQLPESVPNIYLLLLYEYF